MVEAAPATPVVFSIHLLISTTGACIADPDNIPTEPFCELLDAMVALLQSMSSLMSTAFSGKSHPTPNLTLLSNQMSPPRQLS